MLLWLVSALSMGTRVHGSWGDRDTVYRYVLEQPPPAQPQSRIRSSQVG